MAQSIHSPPAAVIAAFALDPQGIEPLAGGLINRSFLALGQGRRVVLQQVSDIFGPRLNEDLDAVTRHLAQRGLVTPRLQTTRDGNLTFYHGNERWRAWRYIPGVTVDKVSCPEQARTAARLVARFHAALGDLDHAFQGARLGVHDTVAHLRHLADTLDQNTDHPAYPAVAPIARDILTLHGQTPRLPATGERIVHGDLKISNVIFDAGSGEALCLIDLDTVGPMALPLELGDAMRSWCNPRAEDDARAYFDLAVFSAAMTGYSEAAGPFISDTEWRAILPATRLITLELAARFAADALVETYFGWNPKRFSSASEHNLVRAAGQLKLARSINAQYAAATAVLESAFSPPGAPVAS